MKTVLPKRPWLESIGIEDFAKVDLRAAKVLSCERIEKSDKLLKLQLETGEDSPRQVVSGIAKWYAPEDLVGPRSRARVQSQAREACAEWKAAA